MSSRRTTISSARYQELQRSETQLRQERQAADRIQRQAQEREREIQSRHNAEVNNLQSQLRTASRQHDAEMRNLSQDFRSNLAAHTAEFQAHLASNRAQTAQSMQNLEQRMRGAVGSLQVGMREISDRVTAVAADYNERFNAIARRQQDERAFAEMSIAELETLLEGVGSLHPERFAPGVYGSMCEQLERARNAFQSQQYSAAHAITQVQMTGAANLLGQLHTDNQVFFETLVIARMRTNEIVERIGFLTDSSAEHSFRLGEDTYTIPFDIDFWTNGQFGEMRTRVAEIDTLLETASANEAINTQVLHTLLIELTQLNRVGLNIQTGEPLRENGELVWEEGLIESLYQFGRDRQIESFVAGDMALQIDDRLNELGGWSLTSSEYRNDDARNPYTMVYEDVSGNQVAMIISPSGLRSGDAIIDSEVFVLGDNERGSVHEREIKDDMSRLISGLGRVTSEAADDCHLNTSTEVFFERYAQPYLDTEAERRADGSLGSKPRA